MSVNTPVGGATQSSYDAILKQLYADDVSDEVYKDNRLLDMLPKWEKFVGEQFNFPVLNANNQSISSQFALISGAGPAGNVFATSNANLLKFQMTQKKHYGTALIDNQVIKNSADKVGGIVSALKFEIDSCLKGVSRNLEVMLYGDGSGVIGSVSVNTSVSGTTATLTLSDPNAVTAFEYGMLLDFFSPGSPNPNFGGTNRQATVQVTAVNRVAGTISVTQIGSNAPSAIQVGDMIARYGDYGNVVSGLSAWLPGAPGLQSGDSFYGINRNQDPTRLAGNFYDGSSQPVFEAIMDAVNQFAREGAMPDTCIVSFANLAKIVKALQTQVRFEDVEEAYFGFKALTVFGPAGPMRIVGTSACPGNKAFLLKMDTWTLGSAGKAVGLIETDGLTILRAPNADAFQARVGGYLNLWCLEPVQNGTVNLA